MIRILLTAILITGFGQVFAGPVDDFNRLVDDVWQWELQQFPENRTYLGLESPHDSWTDHSPAAYAERDAQRGQFLVSLQALDPLVLAEDDQLTYAMVQRRLEESRTAYSLGLHLMTMNMRTGPQHRHNIQE